MVAYGQGVWLALQGSALVRLYHAQTWESLTEVDVAPAVHKMLAGKLCLPSIDTHIYIHAHTHTLELNSNVCKSTSRRP